MRSWTLACLLVLFACDDGAARREDPARERCDIDGLASCAGACEGGGICFEGCCHAPCATGTDCAGAPGCDGFGCVCDEGACIPTSCSATVECGGGLVCIAGSCVEDPKTEVVECTVTPRWGTLRPGIEMAISARGTDASGKVVVPPAAFEMATTSPARASIRDGRLVGGDEAGEVEVVAMAGKARCVGNFLSLGEAKADEIRFLVEDALTGLPREGALVQLDAPHVSLSAASDASGVATLPRGEAGAPPWTISVFHEESTYVTLVGVSNPDMRISLSPHEEGPLAGGFQGRFDSSYFDPSRLGFGLAGASLPGNLLDLTVPVLVGPIERVEIDLGGARSADLSAGLVFGVGNTWFKERYRVLATPGPCDDPVASIQGRCGTRVAWGLAGGIPLEELPIDAIASDGEVDAGSLLARILPSVRRLRSAIRFDTPVEPQPRVGGQPDWSRLPEVDLVASERLSLRVDVKIPDLPSPSVGGIVALAGARLPGRGMVPLGLTGALDEGVEKGGAPTGTVIDPVRGRRGILDLRFAPMHGGLEGSDYLVLVLAVDLAGLSGGKSCMMDDRSGCTPISGKVATRSSLPWGTEVDLSGEAFLGFADEATFDAGSRSFSLGKEVVGAGLYRLQIESAGRKWHVFFPMGSAGLTVPVPAGAEDRVAGSTASVQAIGTATTLDELLGQGDLAALDVQASRFSTIDLPRSR